MKIELVTAPFEKILTLDAARLHLRLDADGSPATHPDDAMIEALIEAAANDLDAPNGFLGRALVTQTWDLYLDGWQDQIFLPFPPLQSVDSVIYRTPEGVNQTLAADQYQVVQGEPSSIIPAYDTNFPDVREGSDVIKIRFTCGYGDADDVPRIIKQYALMQITSWYEHRSTIGQSLSEAPFVRLMLQSYRVGF